MADLIFGPKPGTIQFGYVTGDPWSESLDYKIDGVPAPWPVTPVFRFMSGVIPDLTATLSEGGSRATWSLTVEQVAILDSSSNKRVRLYVSKTWFRGVAIRNA